MLYFLKKKVSHYTLPSHNGHLSATATFLCPQGGRCGEVQLYFTSGNSCEGSSSVLKPAKLTSDVNKEKQKV